MLINILILIERLVESEPGFAALGMHFGYLCLRVLRVIQLYLFRHLKNSYHTGI